MYYRFLLIILLSTFLNVNVAFSQDCETQKQEAWYLLGTEKYDKALKSFRKLEKKNISCLNRKDYYKMAYCAMKMNDAAQAMQYLTVSTEMGLRFRTNDLTAVKKDSVIQFLDKSFATQKVVEKITENMKNFEKGINLKVQKDILKMEANDQKYRSVITQLRQKGTLTKRKWDSLMRYQAIWDTLNINALKNIVKLYGFPAYSLVGYEASHVAWQVAQHADTAFQHRYLKLMRFAFFQNDCDARNLAYLEDRVLMNQDKPQLYGTQFKCADAVDCTIYPIQDIENVDKRRVSMDLPLIDPDYKLPDAKMKN
ncbi:MAG: DUF6624 domain-containing protein [Bacteroidia bacterium]